MESQNLVLLVLIFGVVGFIAGQVGIFISPNQDIHPSIIGVVVMEIILIIGYAYIRSSIKNYEDSIQNY